MTALQPHGAKSEPSLRSTGPTRKPRSLFSTPRGRYRSSQGERKHQPKLSGAKSTIAGKQPHVIGSRPYTHHYLPSPHPRCFLRTRKRSLPGLTEGSSASWPHSQDSNPIPNFSQDLLALDCPHGGGWNKEPQVPSPEGFPFSLPQELQLWFEKPGS